MYQQEGPEVVTQGAVDLAVSEYIGRAMTALKQAR
ncbi:hypothetical protein AVDCRST_MAG94-3785 [uncultured Leptolyngbya sp.]|uniref:Uncharacterized protein n=1 Tax=uncultured Leptolyngbya sp. TaxID=332963 RepID=A0A6J4MTF3_9CYAN|nr:hypothetical protein AVDCRST_MAG94-3785 [uncultured Leptolyngbya sp.]